MKFTNSVLLACLASVAAVNAGVVSADNDFVNDLKVRGNFLSEYSNLRNVATSNVFEKLITESKADNNVDITTIISKVQQRGTYVSDQIKELIDNAIKGIPYKDIAAALEQIKEALSEIFENFPGSASAWSNSSMTAFPILSSFYFTASTPSVVVTSNEIFYSPSSINAISSTKTVSSTEVSSSAKPHSLTKLTSCSSAKPTITGKPDHNGHDNNDHNGWNNKENNNNNKNNNNNNKNNDNKNNDNQKNNNNKNNNNQKNDNNNNNKNNNGNGRN